MRAVGRWLGERWITIGSPFTVLVLWEWASATGLLLAVFFPRPSTIAGHLRDLAMDAPEVEPPKSLPPATASDQLAALRKLVASLGEGQVFGKSALLTVKLLTLSVAGNTFGYSANALLAIMPARKSRGGNQSFSAKSVQTR